MALQSPEETPTPTPTPPNKPVSNNSAKKKFQAELCKAVAKGDFKKTARLRESIANLK